MTFLRPHRPRPLQPGDVPTGGGLAPVPVASSPGFLVSNPPQSGVADLTPYAGRPTRPARNDLRSTIRPYDPLPENAGANVLLVEASRDQQIGQQVAQPPFMIPGPRRLEPTTYRGD